MRTAVIPERVQQVVAEDLCGAEARQCVLVEEDGGTLERIYIVLWRRCTGPSGDYEYGTHRVVVNEELDEAACMWGHRFSVGRGSLNAIIVQAYKDFNARVASGT
jgi:hypothetical protein